MDELSLKSDEAPDKVVGLFWIAALGRPNLLEGNQKHSVLDFAHLEHGFSERIASEEESVEPTPRLLEDAEAKGDWPSQARFDLLQAGSME